ncbi:MAG: hypothetical protein CFE28_03860 [Alphaproteobacteria bacterium PA2]|nr:MAG: hypothetical protein CFE28_03860 [Alphaproteobacteria bacterium PA2]
MAILNTLKLVEFKPHNGGGRVQLRRRKLADKIDQQILLANDPSYRPTKIVWTKDGNGSEQRREIPKRIKRWWVQNMDGTVQLTIRYGSKALELAKGKCAIECASVAEISDVLTKIKAAAENGELDEILNGDFGPSISILSNRASK